MKTVKHTPGPWGLSRLEPTAGDIYWVQSEKQICIAEIPSYRMTGANESVTAGEFEANASLIAAAPELLEAAEYFDYAAGLWDREIEDAEEISITITGAALKQLKAAITKAKGGDK